MPFWNCIKHGITQQTPGEHCWQANCGNLSFAETLFSELRGLQTQTIKVVLFQYFLIMCISQKRKDHEAQKIRHEKATARCEGQADLLLSSECLGLFPMRGCFGCGHRSFPVPAMSRQMGSALALPQLLVTILLLVGRLLSGVLLAHPVWAFAMKWAKWAITQMLNYPFYFGCLK